MKLAFRDMGPKDFSAQGIGNKLLLLYDLLPLLQAVAISLDVDDRAMVQDPVQDN